MKRLYIALAILAVIFAATLYNAYFLNRLTGQITGLLEQAEEFARASDWRSAQTLTEKAGDIWSSHELYLHIALRHGHLDEVETGFHELREYLLAGEGPDYLAANARLIAKISMLYEAEQLSLKNVL